MPDVQRIVISNTTPIITLALIQKLVLYKELYGEVLIPPTVKAELLAGGSRAGASEIQNARYIRTAPLLDPRRADLLSDLDRGEAEVIALAMEHNADLVIIDERLARRHAQRVGLYVTGVLGVLLRAKKQALVDEIHPLIHQLRQSGIRFSDALIKQVLEMADE